jgi:hypothetical protein
MKKAVANGGRFFRSGMHEKPRVMRGALSFNG